MTVIICGFYTLEANRLYLPLVDVKAHATILASNSRTKLTQTFVNSSSAKIREARYAFPLYDGVSVVAFTCRIGDRTIVGEVKEREKAKQDFKQAVASGQRAALFEQVPEASDCFVTSVGNIPPGAKVVVDITYIGELKHDAEVDGTRFTIPAKIVPRYGDYPVSLMSRGTQLVDGKMDITVDVVLPRQSSIQKIQSPSHPISVNIGATSIAPNAEPTLSKASATFGVDSVGMDKDFVLQVVAKDTGVPTALLETHPTIPNHRALMTTLVPRFTLPSERPEIVFVVDRSGSMSGSPIQLVKSALKVFLKSIPIGVKFNICSFGSTFSFLWNRSQSYSQDTLDKALAHVNKMDADLGGTEMFAPISATIKKRFKDLNLEILLLTDGEIWDQQRLFDYLNKEVAEATMPLRVFTLGIGSGVSHALIEGIARAGHGFSQAVSDGEKMESKLVRMLKGAMSPHVSDYTLEVKYASDTAMDIDRDSTSQSEGNDDDDFELIDRVEDCLKIDAGQSDKKGKEKEKDRDVRKKPISLFDTSVDLDKDDSKSLDSEDTTGEGRYNHLPVVQPPKIIQTPHIIPPLFAFNRTTVYLLMSPECSHRTPKSVILRGKSKHGPLELEIPIQILKGHDEFVHQLAAKKAASELEQGRGWLKYARDRESGKLLSEMYDSRYSDMVEREAVRLGVQFQISGKWTSFVALEKNPSSSTDGQSSSKKERHANKKGKMDDKEKESNAESKESSEEDEEDESYECYDDSDDLPAYSESPNYNQFSAGARPSRLSMTITHYTLTASDTGRSNSKETAHSAGADDNIANINHCLLSPVDEPVGTSRSGTAARMPINDVSQVPERGEKLEFLLDQSIVLESSARPFARKAKKKSISPFSGLSNTIGAVGSTLGSVGSSLRNSLRGGSVRASSVQAKSVDASAIPTGFNAPPAPLAPPRPSPIAQANAYAAVPRSRSSAAAPPPPPPCAPPGGAG
ncbi:hypothetical protein BGW42_007046, partial [Actinomortierella wolfii]